MGNFPSLFLATVNQEGGLEYYDGHDPHRGRQREHHRGTFGSGAIFHLSRRSERRLFVHEKSRSTSRSAIRRGTIGWGRWPG